MEITFTLTLYVLMAFLLTGLVTIGWQRHRAGSLLTAEMARAASREQLASYGMSMSR